VQSRRFPDHRRLERRRQGTLAAGRLYARWSVGVDRQAGFAQVTDPVPGCGFKARSLWPRFLFRGTSIAKELNHRGALHLGGTGNVGGTSSVSPIFGSLPGQGLVELVLPNRF